MMGLLMMPSSISNEIFLLQSMEGSLTAGWGVNLLPVGQQNWNY
jgi:hypothetical protein